MLTARDASPKDIPSAPAIACRRCQSPFHRYQNGTQGLTYRQTVWEWCSVVACTLPWLAGGLFYPGATEQERAFLHNPDQPTVLPGPGCEKCALSAAKDGCNSELVGGWLNRCADSAWESDPTCKLS
jgi:hypothetical protein